MGFLSLLTSLIAWLARTWQQLLGGLLSLGAVALTLVIGFADLKDPGTLAVLAVVGQFGSAWLFAQHRKADPAHARTIVRQLIAVRARLSALVSYVEQVQEKRDPKATAPELREAFGRVNVEVTISAEDCGRVVESWGDFDPGTLRSLEWEASNNPTSGDGAPSDEGAE